MSAYDARRRDLEDWLERVKRRVDESWWREVGLAIKDARGQKEPGVRLFEPRPEHARIVGAVVAALDEAAADPELTPANVDTLEQLVCDELGVWAAVRTR